MKFFADKFLFLRSRQGIATTIISMLSWIFGLTIIAIFSLGVIRARHHALPEIDSYGYFLPAKMIAQGHWPIWQDNFAKFHGHVWVSVGDGKVMSKYPPGWPALLAIGFRIDGLSGAMWVNPILAIAGAIAFFLLARTLFGVTAAMVCSGLWLFSPLLAFYDAYPLSHAADVSFVIIAMLLAAWWGKHKSVLLALAAGICCGFLPAIRPTSILILPAAITLGAAMRWQVEMRLAGEDRRMPFGPWIVRPLRRFRSNFRERRVRRILRQNAGVIAFAIGVAITFVPLMVYNSISFGAPWRSGYGLSGEQTAFDFSKWTERLDALINARLGMLSGIAWLLGLAGIALRRGRTGIAWAMTLWFIPTFALYLGYYWWPGAQPNFMRFLLSALPAWVLCAGFLFVGAQTSKSIFARSIVFVFAAIISIINLRATVDLSRDELRRVNWREDARNIFRDPFEWPAEWKSDWSWMNSLTKSHDTQKPIVVFAQNAAMWTAGVLPDVETYDLSAFRDQHFLSPMAPACREPHDSIIEDPARHAWLHEQIGRFSDSESLRNEFNRRVLALADAGRTVFVITYPNDKMLARLFVDQRFDVTPAGSFVFGTTAFRITRNIATTQPTSQPSTGESHL